MQRKMEIGSANLNNNQFTLNKEQKHSFYILYQFM